MTTRYKCGFKFNEMKHKSKNNITEQEFELKLFRALKSFGYLFPDSIRGVERFEELYGNTDVDFPEHLQSPDSFTNNQDVSFGLDFSIRMAALSPKKNEPFTLLGDDLNEDSDENPDKKPKA